MAKFKVGDKVRHVDDGQDGPVGVVKGVYGDGKIKVKFPGLMKDGFDGFEEEELVMANGCARNSRNPVVAKAMNAAVRNADFKTGDIVVPFSSAVDWCTDAIDTLRTGQASSAQRMLQQAKAAAQEVTKYPEADAGYRGLMRKGLQLLDAAIANPTEASISAARKVLEEGRARAAGTSPRTTFNARRARNAGGYDNSLGREVDRLADRIAKKFKELAESYAYWIEADCGRQVDALLRDAKQDKGVQPSIIAELERLRRRVNDAVAASKNLPM